MIETLTYLFSAALIIALIYFANRFVSQDLEQEKPEEIAIHPFDVLLDSMNNLFLDGVKVGVLIYNPSNELYEAYSLYKDGVFKDSDYIEAEDFLIIQYQNHLDTKPVNKKPKKNKKNDN